MSIPVRPVRPRYCHPPRGKELHRAVHALIHDDPCAWAGMSEEQVNGVMGEYFAYSAGDPRRGHLRRRRRAEGPRGGADGTRARRQAGRRRTARSPRPRSSSAATTSSIATRSSRRSTRPLAFRARASARSRCARSHRCEQAAAAARGHQLALPRVVRSGGRCPRAQRRRSRSRRGGRAGRVRHGARALAARRRCRTSPARGSSARRATARSTACAAVAWPASASVRPSSSRRCAGRSSPSATRRSATSGLALMFACCHPRSRTGREHCAHAAARRGADARRDRPRAARRRPRPSHSGSCARSARCATRA